jgi:hypothetical protein
MEDDLIELARICLEQARVAQAPNVAAELRRMAKDYRRRAVRARNGLDGETRKVVLRDQQWFRSSFGTAALQAAFPSQVPHHAHRAYCTAAIIFAGVPWNARSGF